MYNRNYSHDEKGINLVLSQIQALLLKYDVYIIYKL